jgi:hypothetical protein
MSIRVAESLGRGLLALADLPPVDDEVVIVRDAVDLYRTERVFLETHLASAPPGSVPTIPQAQNFLGGRGFGGIIPNQYTDRPETICAAEASIRLSATTRAFAERLIDRDEDRSLVLRERDR